MTNAGMLELCNIFYDKRKLEHAKRVANTAIDLCSLFKNSPDKDFIYQLGLAHDLYEDTNIKQNTWFDKTFEKNLQLLTKKENEDYNDYIYTIHKKASTDPYYLPAYIVKLADMHDHFAQTETLTEKLKNKYVAAMPYLI